MDVMQRAAAEFLGPEEPREFGEVVHFVRFGPAAQNACSRRGRKERQADRVADHLWVQIDSMREALD